MEEKAIPSSKIEVIFNYGAPKQGDNGKFLSTPIERIVLIDGEEIYRDKQMPFLYVRDKSILRQFENWVNELSIHQDYQKNTLPEDCPDKKQILKHCKTGLSTQCDPQKALKELVCSLTKTLSDIELQCLADYKHLSAQNIPLAEGIRNPSPFDILSSLKAMLDAYIENYTFYQSPEFLQQIHDRI